MITIICLAIKWDVSLLAGCIPFNSKTNLSGTCEKPRQLSIWRCGPSGWNCIFNYIKVNMLILKRLIGTANPKKPQNQTLDSYFEVWNKLFLGIMLSIMIFLSMNQKIYPMKIYAELSMCYCNLLIHFPAYKETTL